MKVSIKAKTINGEEKDITFKNENQFNNIIIYVPQGQRLDEVKINKDEFIKSIILISKIPNAKIEIKRIRYVGEIIEITRKIINDEEYISINFESETYYFNTSELLTLIEVL